MLPVGKYGILFRIDLWITDRIHELSLSVKIWPLISTIAYLLINIVRLFSRLSLNHLWRMTELFHESQEQPFTVFRGVKLYWNGASSWVSLVNLLHVVRTPFPRNTCGALLLENSLRDKFYQIVKWMCKF